MRSTTEQEELDLLDFAKRAAGNFQAHPSHSSYTDCGVPDPGELLALRWGMDGDRVLVLRVDECFDTVNYGGLLPRRRDQAES